jgi:hypothetical protein
MAVILTQLAVVLIIVLAALSTTIKGRFGRFDAGHGSISLLMRKGRLATDRGISSRSMNGASPYLVKRLKCAMARARVGRTKKGGLSRLKLALMDFLIRNQHNTLRAILD